MISLHIESIVFGAKAWITFPESRPKGDKNEQGGVLSEECGDMIMEIKS